MNETSKQESSQTASQPTSPESNNVGLVGTAVTVIFLFAAAPFFGLTSGVGGWISLFIIFIGLRQAWHLTGRSQILVMGPYERSAAQ